MELAQLVGVVRHLSAQSAALQYLDQALTVVTDLDTQIDGRKKSLAEVDKLVQQKSDLLQQLDHEIEAKRGQAEDDLVQRQIKATLEIQQLIEQKQQTTQMLESDIARLTGQVTAKQQELQATQLLVDSANKDLDLIRQSHHDVVLAIQDLKSKLG